MDIATPQLWTETVFGLTSGWWRFTDRDLRPRPAAARSARSGSESLQEAGFSETASLPGLIGPTAAKARSACSRARRGSDRAGAPIATDGSAGGKIVAHFRRRSPVSGEQLGRATARRRCALPDRAPRRRIRSRRSRHLHAPRRKRRKIGSSCSTACADDAPLERIVYLWNLDAPAEVGEDDALMGTDALLHLSQALEATHAGGKAAHRFGHARRAAGGPRDGRDRGRASAGDRACSASSSTNTRTSPAAASICRRWRPAPMPPCFGANCCGTTPSAKSPSAAKRATSQRLDRGRPSVEQTLDPAVPLRLESRERGHLDTLRFAPFALPPCGPGEVLIDVKAAGMNFRDVLKALALYPGEAPDARIFGDEVGGVVKAVGAGVKHVAPGDRVFGLAVFGLATQTLARGGDVRRIPDGLVLRGSGDAAGGLHDFMARAEERRAAARGRAHPRPRGRGRRRHGGDPDRASSRRGSHRQRRQPDQARAARDARREARDRLAARRLRRSGDGTDRPARRGRRPQRARRRSDPDGPLVPRGVRPLHRDRQARHLPELAHPALAAAAQRVVPRRRDGRRLQRRRSADAARCSASSPSSSSKARCTPLPFRSFPACRIDAAFRLMAGGKHIGKVVVSFPEPFVPRRGEPLAPPFAIKPDGCYLITGAFGGFGKVLAEWLVEMRRAAPRAQQPQRRGHAGGGSVRAEPARPRRRVQVVQARRRLAEDVARLLAEIRAGDQPLRGVFHLAMVIDDAPLAALNRERMRTVMAPKAHGAWLLHEGTRDHERSTAS